MVIIPKVKSLNNIWIVYVFFSQLNECVGEGPGLTYMETFQTG